jgi:hypothetical protein
MAILVLHKQTGIRYVLIGTGYGAYSSSNSSLFGGDLFPNEEHGEIQLAALSDSNGCIIWLPTEELQVMEIDGVAVGKLLTASSGSPGEKAWKLPSDPSPIESVHANEAETEPCPACGQRVLEDVRECPSCGLTLINDESV